jgi:hypothetical protein
MLTPILPLSLMKSSVTFLTVTGLKVTFFAATQIFTIAQMTQDGKDRNRMTSPYHARMLSTVNVWNLDSFNLILKNLIFVASSV